MVLIMSQEKFFKHLSNGDVEKVAETLETNPNLAKLSHPKNGGNTIITCMHFNLHHEQAPEIIPLLVKKWR
jgi:hypothetical protein